MLELETIVRSCSDLKGPWVKHGVGGTCSIVSFLLGEFTEVVSELVSGVKLDEGHCCDLSGFVCENFECQKSCQKVFCRTQSELPYTLSNTCHCGVTCGVATGDNTGTGIFIYWAIQPMLDVAGRPRPR